MKRILLVCLTAVFALASSAVWAQERTVTGRVTSAEDGSGLPGVNVVLKGTTNGTVTDVNGAYTLKVTGDGGVLVYTFIGLITQEAEIGSRSSVDIAMQSDTKQLSEVVVTALGVQRQEKSLTYAVQNVDGDAMSKARETNVVNSLQGQVAGVQITNSSGNPNSSSRIVLRGPSSITGSNQPLFVVDGVPIDNRNLGDATEGGGTDLPNGAADINPDDVESISVLKGPVAAALYGNRGANGVILVTTKTGKGSKGLGVSVNHSTTFMTPLRLPSFQNSYGQGSSYTYFEYLDGQNGDGDGVDESWGPALDKGLNFAQWPDYGKGTVSPWVSRPDNIRDIYRTGKTINNNVAVTGGDGKHSFRLSATDSRTDGIIPTQNLDRTTFNGSGSVTLLDRLEATLSASYINTRSDNMGGGGYDDQNPVQQTLWSGRNVDFNALKNYNSLPLAPEGTASQGTPLNWNNQFQNNLFWVLDNNQHRYNKERVIGNVALNYKATDWLSLSVRSGVDSWSSRNADRSAVGTNSFLNGFYQEISRRFSEVNHFFLATFNKSFSDFNVTFSAGGNIMDQTYTRQTGELPALQLPGVYNLSNLKSGFTAVNTNRYERQKINSLLGNGQISYKDYLFLEFSGRNDWWSILPLSNNSYFYPSASLSAILSDIFEINSTTLSYLKVRGGWSRVGSAGGLKPYSIQQTYSFRADPWGPTPLLYNPELLNNPNLTPETVTGIELGLAAKFFENRVSLDVTYFDQKSEDLIVEVEVSPSSGYEKALDNVGEIRNRGVEIQLGAQLVKTTDFTAGIKVNFAKYKNEVIRVNAIDNDQGAIVLGGQWNVDLQVREGQPFGVLFGPGYLKDNAGNVVHANGLPVVDTNYKILGNIQPDWNGGVSLDLGYKNFTFNTLVDAKIGGDLYSMTTTWGRTAGVLEESLIGREGGIVGRGVMQVGETEGGDPIYAPNNVVVSAESYNHTAYSQNVAESSVFDASYVKLRQIMFGYRVPNGIMGKLPFRDVTIGFVARNVALLYSKIPHVDPESAFSSEDNDQGLEFGQIPSVRSLGFNINFKL